MAKGFTKKDLLSLFDEIKTEQAREFPLTEIFLKRYFKPAVLENAKQYLTNKQIGQIDANNDFSQITSEVFNSLAEPSHQHIQIIRDNANITLNAHCSCKVQRKCKHIAAVLLKLKTEHSGEFGQNYLLHDWFNQLEKLKVNQKPLNKDVILFVIEPFKGSLIVTPKVASVAKNGKFGLGRLLTEKQLSSQVTPENLDEADFRLISWVRSQNTFGKLMLEGQWGAIALLKLIATERCFWQDSRDALSMTNSRPLEFNWHNEGNNLSLQANVTGCKSWQLFNTVPPYFIDVEQLVIGELVTPLQSDEIKHLLTMPVINTNMQTQVEQRFNQLFGMSVIKQNGEVSRKVKKLSIKPVISFEYFNQNPVVRLQFQYPNELLNSESELQDNSLGRNLSFENTCINRLKNAGFVDCKGPLQHVEYYSLAISAERPALWHCFVNEITQNLKKDGWQINGQALQQDEITEGQLMVHLSRDKKNKLVIEPYFFLADKRYAFADFLTISSLCNNTAQTFYYICLPNERWVAFAKVDVEILIAFYQEFYQGKKYPKRLNLPLAYARKLSGFQKSQITSDEASLLELTQLVAKDDFGAKLQVPKKLNATLRDYQIHGLHWLRFLKKFQLGGILADDMGLGKTLQTIAFLLAEQGKGKVKLPSLIICPTSLVNNWLQELQRFAPSLNVVVSFGSQRQKQFVKLSKADCVITTYPLLVRDEAIFNDIAFEHVILDEAQTIKNINAKVSRHVKALNSNFNLCLSGTPVENNLSELKSLLDFAMPGLLPSQTHFKEFYQTPIEKEHNQLRADQLKELVKPFLLRRTKAQVVTELPAKTEMVKMLELMPSQQKCYGEIRQKMEFKLKDLFAEIGIDKSRLAFLEALLKLRQICCSPQLLSDEGLQFSFADSTKLDWLAKHLPAMLQQGRKVIIFSQFTSMLSLIEQQLQALNLGYAILTGQTRDRQSAVDSFQQGDKSIFLISLKAGGTGLNLTAADTVIHFDPWWNPAVEQQATDRAYRIGQKKPVFVYKLICQDTIEERVYEMQQNKAALAESFFDAASKQFSVSSAEEILALLK